MHNTISWARLHQGGLLESQLAIMNSNICPFSMDIQKHSTGALVSILSLMLDVRCRQLHGKIWRWIFNLTEYQEYFTYCLIKQNYFLPSKKQRLVPQNSTKKNCQLTWIKVVIGKNIRNDTLIVCQFWHLSDYFRQMKMRYHDLQI